MNIKISGTATDGDLDPYTLTISYSNWFESEPNGATKVLKTKKGTALFKTAPDRGTYLQNAGGTVVAFLRNLSPQNSSKGDSGQGNANETGRNLRWSIDSIT